MKSHRVENIKGNIKPKGEPDDEFCIKLLVAVAEQALLDYKNVCRWLAHPSCKQKDAILERIDEYYALREYFNNGCDGLLDCGKYSLAYQVDTKLQKEKIDTDIARYNASKMLSKISKDYIRQWYDRKTRKLKKEANDEYGWDEYARRGRKYPKLDDYDE